MTDKQLITEWNDLQHQLAAHPLVLRSKAIKEEMMKRPKTRGRV